MVTIRQHGPTASRHPIDRTREPRSYGHHSAPQRRTVARFHDEMRVIPLQGIVHEPEAGSLAARSKGAFDLVNDAHRP